MNLCKEYRRVVTECEQALVLSAAFCEIGGGSAALALGGCLAVDGRHCVSELRDILQAFCAEPRCVLPVEPFAKGVVWCGHIPVTVNVWSVNRAL